MSQAAALRRQIESALQDRIPSALTPRPAGTRESTPCGIDALDELMQGGFPAGAITELVGPECSGRTTAALSFLAQVTAEGSVCAWIDVADTLDPESAAAMGVDLERLLWVRCAAGDRKAPEQPLEQSLETSAASTCASSQPAAPAGCGSPHPRSETRGMSEAIGKLLSAQPRSAALQPGRRNRSIGTPGAPNRPLQHFSSEREEQVPTDRRPGRRGYKSEASTSHHAALLQRSAGTGTETKQKAAPPERMLPLVLPVRKEKRTPAHTWTALERALRSIDLLLQGGGFRAIVLDLGSTPAEMAWRIPLATWFRFRSASERSRISFVLLSRHACARSSAELVLQMQPGEFLHQGAVMTGMQYRSSVERQRQHRPAGNVIPMRKPPQGDRTRAGVWQCGTTWAHAQ